MGKLTPYGEQIVKWRDIDQLTFFEIQDQLRKSGIVAARSTVQDQYRLTKKLESLPDTEDIDDIIQDTNSNSIVAEEEFIAAYQKDLLHLMMDSATGVAASPVKYIPNNISKLLILSDIHHGKKIVDEYGKTIFDPTIARQRLESIGQTLITNCKMFPDKIDEVVVALLGDLVDNEIIYDGQVYNIDDPLLVQMKNVTRDIWECILMPVAKEVKVPIRVVAVAGNHARTGHKQSSKMSNWDNVVYNNLKIMAEMAKAHALTKQDISVEFSIETFWNFDIRGWKFHARHSGPRQIETPAMSTKIGGWYKKHRMDAMLYAHNHHPSVFNWKGLTIIMNGCLCGADDYAEELATDGDPSQWLVDVSDLCPVKRLELLHLE